MRLTSFGVFIRKFRLDHSITLKDMAEVLGISSPYLSGIECGTRSIPEGFEEKLLSAYKLTGNVATEFKEAIDQSKRQFTLTPNDNLDKTLVGSLNRNLSSLDDERKKMIIKILNGEL
ncbi:Helix-turn-helix domain-containing protein [Succinivibrio dextrinosolvens DSM 3072]|uniref:Helix-turn-helix domain-containing protein n=1 Tax=Succinivibrio dextrinosolvens DSM 3072 TaxID=1123324 RepID=A0A1T4VF21_9GAMM|nr:helix-turn-helix domain-containing protein [Succinivibrio dextrinosolvens]SKA63550.1 Helix-turn-helix domain-containing protein [Succinivibrio dextrinosolvens DSM 3072]